MILNLGTMDVYDLLSIEFCTWKSKQVVFSTLVFSYDEQERFDSQLWYFPVREMCFVALYGFLQHWYEVRLLAQRYRWVKMLKLQNGNYICSCVFCSEKVCVGNKASSLFSDPPLIPAVCSTLVMCFLCLSLLFTSSLCHKTWWYSLVPKKRN